MTDDLGAHGQGEHGHGEHEEPAHRIVVGIDGSEASAPVLEWAGRQAELTGAELDIVVAWEWPTSYGWVAPMPDAFDPAADARSMVSDALGEVAGAHPSVKASGHVVEGHPAPALVRRAEGAALLVVGSRGHGEFAGMLLGSVSAHCVAHAPCTVVVVRPEA